jgi:hypothetical protein
MPVLTHMHTFAYKDEYVYVLVYAHVHTRDFDQGFLEVQKGWRFQRLGFRDLGGGRHLNRMSIENTFNSEHIR